MKRTRFLFLPALAILLLLIGLLGLGSQRLGLVQASGTAVQVTNCNDSGPGSLRDTIASAASGSSISFRLSCDIKLNSTLSISQTLTLTGEGQQVILDGQHAVQVLSVNGGVTLTLKALTIANSSSSGSGISNWGTLRISNSTISGNAGVGIDNEGGTVRISNSTVSGNSGGAGIFNDGGTVRISNSTVSGNAGGGIIFSFGTASISNSTVSGNAGGGITNSGTLTLSNSTISGNSGDGIYNFTEIDSSRSGAIHFESTMRISNSTDCNASYSSGSTMCITNSTIFGNAGGGIYNDNGTVRISNSTISGNSGGAGIFNDSGLLDTTLSISNSTISGNSFGGISNGSGTVRIGGSIVANNTGSNCAGILTDQGYNLSSDTSCHLSAKTSLQNSDAKLDPSGLQNNGGPTQTIALQPDSPAVDRIPVGSQCPATDQRGVSRPQGPKCDIGAFETTAADGLRVMTHVVNSFQLAKGLQTSLDQQVQAVLAALRAHQTAQTCQDLTSFINYVQAQSGKGLTRAQVTTFLQEAAVIHTRLGC